MLGGNRNQREQENRFHRRRVLHFEDDKTFFNLIEYYYEKLTVSPLNAIKTKKYDVRET